MDRRGTACYRNYGTTCYELWNNNAMLMEQPVMYHSVLRIENFGTIVEAGCLAPGQFFDAG